MYHSTLIWFCVNNLFIKITVCDDNFCKMSLQMKSLRITKTPRNRKYVQHLQPHLQEAPANHPHYCTPQQAVDKT